MRFKVGSKVCVKDVYSGGNFDNGDIVTIKQIGNDGDPDCYGAISPHDGLMWYLCEDEVCAVTNADRIRAMSDEELCKLLMAIPGVPCEENGYPEKCNNECAECIAKWLRQPSTVAYHFPGTAKLMEE